jgi:hypothetical protein
MHTVCYTLYGDTHTHMHHCSVHTLGITSVLPLLTAATRTPTRASTLDATALLSIADSSQSSGDLLSKTTWSSLRRYCSSPTTQPTTLSTSTCSTSQTASQRWSANQAHAHASSTSHRDTIFTRARTSSMTRLLACVHVCGRSQSPRHCTPRDRQSVRMLVCTAW